MFLVEPCEWRTKPTTCLLSNIGVTIRALRTEPTGRWRLDDSWLLKIFLYSYCLYGFSLKLSLKLISFKSRTNFIFLIFSTQLELWNKWHFMFPFKNMSEKARRMRYSRLSTYSNAHAIVPNLILGFQFQEKWFEFGIILNGFRRSIIWVFQRLFKYKSLILKILKIPEFSLRIPVTCQVTLPTDGSPKQN